jgi:tetratricopeptide (TPR) repeat protein
MRLLKLLICGLVTVSLAIAICLGLNYFFGLFNYLNGAGTDIASWISISTGVVFVIYLFYPKQVEILFQRYWRKKVDDQFGEVSQNSRNLISKIANQRADVACVQEVNIDKEGIRVKKTNLQCIDNRFKSVKDLVRAIKEEGRGRSCIAKTMALCCDETISSKNRIGFCGILETIYEIAGDMYVTASDFKTRIKNAEGMLRYCDVNSKADWPYCDLEWLASHALMRVIFTAHRFSYFNLALEAYNILALRKKFLEYVEPERLSQMYELIGVIWLSRDFNRSLNYLNLAIKHDSRNYIAFYFLAQLNYQEKYNYEQALEYANKSFAHLPEDAPEDLVRKVMTIQYFCYTLKRDYFKAREIISNIDRELTISWIVGNKAYLNFMCEDYIVAEKLAEKALKMNPDEGSALNTMGMLMLHRGQYAHAIKHFIAALRTIEKGKYGSEDRYFYCEICNNCAIAYYENQDEESAREWFDKALASGGLCVDMQRYDALKKMPVSGGKCSEATDLTQKC